MIIKILVFIILNFIYSNINAQIHSAPIIIKAKDIKAASGYPIVLYRVFKTTAKLKAVMIPFQIDEVNEFEDFVLDKGQSPNTKDGNGIFDSNDELVFMGNDVGEAIPPREWSVEKPSLLFEIKFKNPATPQKIGAVYLGIYFKPPPPLLNVTYVKFDPNTSEIISAKFSGAFDKDNHISIKTAGMIDPKTKTSIPLISHSAFYLRANFKYFLTFEVNHRDLKSYLDAYKIGPVRVILRVNFFYNVLKINFRLGMYTEISIFSNAIYLPTILHNPIDGSKILNKDSGFYYGFNITKNPQSYKINTNFPLYNKDFNTIFAVFKTLQPIQKIYWLEMISEDHMIYIEFELSDQMVNKNNTPYLYLENKDGFTINNDKTRIKDKPAPLGKSAVNIALYLELANLAKGEQHIAFKVFFENKNNPETMNSIKNASLWSYELTEL